MYGANYLSYATNDWYGKSSILNQGYDDPRGLRGSYAPGLGASQYGHNHLHGQEPVYQGYGYGAYSPGYELGTSGYHHHHLPHRNHYPSAHLGRRSYMPYGGHTYQNRASYVPAQNFASGASYFPAQNFSSGDSYFPTQTRIIRTSYVPTQTYATRASYAPATRVIRSSHGSSQNYLGRSSYGGLGHSNLVGGDVVNASYYVDPYAPPGYDNYNYVRPHLVRSAFGRPSRASYIV